MVARLRDEHDDVLYVGWSRYWSFGTRNDLEMLQIGSAPTVDADRPVTGDNKPGIVSVTSVSWRRGGDGLVVTRTDTMHPERITDPGARPGNKLLWCDEARWATLVADWSAIWADHKDRARPLDATADSAERRLIDAWEQRATAAEYTRFVTKYGTEAAGRWDAHRKTFARRLSWPHGHNVLTWLMERAAELDLLGDEPTTVTALVEQIDGDHGISDKILADVANLEF